MQPIRGRLAASVGFLQGTFLGLPWGGLGLWKGGREGRKRGREGLRLSAFSRWYPMERETRTLTAATVWGAESIIKHRGARWYPMERETRTLTAAPVWGAENITNT